MPILAKKKLFTTQYYDDYHKGKRKVNQTAVRPTSAHRSNNPHPSSDFLMPRNLKQQDGQAVMQHRVQRAVHDYVLKALGEGNLGSIKRVMEHREYPQLTQSPHGPGVSVHSHTAKGEPIDAFINTSLDILDHTQKKDRQELKRERGNHYKAASKSYGDIPDASQTPIFTYQSAERKPMIDISLDPTMTNKTKRTHTPPTPPANARRPKTAAYEAQLKAERANANKSRPVLYRAKTAPVTDEWEDVEEDEEKELEREIKSARPSPSLRKQSATPDNLAPRMKAWADGATDYEKKVAYNLLQTLNGGQGPAKPSQARPKAPTLGLKNGRRTSGTPASRQSFRAPSATHVYVPPSPAPIPAVPNRNGREDSQVQDWMKKLRQKLELQEPAINVKQYVKTVSLPKPGGGQRKKRVSIAEDYTHENSHFMMTQPTYRRHFIIAPDWVSERSSHRSLQKQSWARKNRLGKGVGC